MTYEEQLKIEKINKEIFDRITTKIPAEDFISFYRTHNQKETLEHYGIRTTKQLTKILKFFNYDFSVPKGLAKGKPSTRSHENYVAGGKKSAETQRKNWQAKSAEEKQAWSDKQRKAHDTEEFRSAIRQINIDYYASLTHEEKAERRQRLSTSAKTVWASHSEEEKEEIMANRFKNGRHYHSKDSGPNSHFATLLDRANISYERELCLDLKKFDFNLTDKKILIEIDPTITHNVIFIPFPDKEPLDKYYHKDKSALANKYGYRCIHVFDWDNPDKIIQLLAKKETIYARECEIKEVPAKIAKEFINNNHLQGYAKDYIRYGLHYKDTLVSIMTFDRPRYNHNYDYELVRYCSSINVVGGAERLFKHFLKAYPDKSILSYCDLSKFSGQTYINLGFTLLRVSAPAKHWYNRYTKEHYTDNLLRQQGFSRLIHHCDAKEDNLHTNDNEVLMLEANFLPIYDCGQATYIYQK